MISLDEKSIDRKALISTIKHQRWFAQQNSEIEHITIDDWLTLQPGKYDEYQRPALLWMKISVCTKEQVVTYSAILQQDGGDFSDASLSTEFIQAIKLAGRSGLTTTEGAKICLNGDICYEVFTSICSLDEGSSNTLQRCTTLHKDCVIKLYRTLTPINKTEQRVLHALKGQNETPTLLGHITYQPSPGQSDCLGIITEFLPGEPIHRIFSRDIKAKIREFLSGESENFTDMSTHLLQVCQSIGSNVFAFHENLQQAFNRGSQSFDCQGYLNSHQQVCTRILNYISEDEMIDNHYKRQFNESLQFCANTLLVDNPQLTSVDIPVSIAHGDLHLAHIFIDQDTLQCQLIDPSPASIRPDHEDYSSQLSLSDLVSLQRGLEYFSFDEVCDAIPSKIKNSETDIVNVLLTFFDSQAFQQNGLASLLHIYSSQVFNEIFDAYCKRCKPQELTNIRRLYRTFYFGRLLRELEYNFCYGRQFFKACDLFYLNQLTEDLKKCTS